MKKDGNKPIVFKWILYIGILFIGIIIGVLTTTSVKNKKSTSRGEEVSSLRLGLVENNLTITDIRWSNFPGWRNVECTIDGTFSINLPHNASINFCDLTNTECLKEISRETINSLDSNTESNYDFVCYEITDGILAATGVIKKYDNSISIAESGYQVCATWNEGADNVIFGYIPPENAIFTPWTSLENTYADYHLTPYLDAFQLSRTYLDENLNTEKKLCFDIKVEKVEDGLMNCNIENLGNTEWTFSADLPALEMWYNGVWIEVLSPYDSALMTYTCAAGETYKIKFPADVNDSYPSLFPGIYRLVIYGENNDYAVSDSFLVLFNHDIQLLKY